MEAMRSIIKLWPSSCDTVDKLLEERLLPDKFSCPDFLACLSILSCTPSLTSSFLPKPALGFRGLLPLDAMFNFLHLQHVKYIKTEVQALNSYVIFTTTVKLHICWNALSFHNDLNNYTSGSLPRQRLPYTAVALVNITERSKQVNFYSRSQWPATQQGCH